MKTNINKNNDNNNCRNNITIPWYRSIVFKQALGLLLLLLPITCFFGMLYNLLQKNSTDNLLQLTASSDSLIFDTFENRLDNIKLCQIMLLGKSEAKVISALWDIEEAPKRIDRALEMKKRLSIMNESNELSTDIKLYMMNANLLITDKVIRSLTMDDYQKAEWAERTGGSVFVENSNLVVISASINRLGDDSRVDYFCETVINNMEISRLLWSSLSDQTKTKVLIVNDEPIFTYNTINSNTTGAHATSAAASSDILELFAKARANNDMHTADIISIGQEKFLYTVIQSPKYNIAMVTLRSYNELSFRNLWIMNTIPIFIIIFLFATIVYLLYFNRFIKRPIIILLDAFRDIVGGQAHTIRTHAITDEFDQLYEGFNEMNRLLREKNEQVYHQKIEMQKSELKQLQAQIDPHFLYNSLFIVKAKIWNKDYEGAMRLTELLGEYFQFLNRNTKSFVPLETELSHAFIYAHIQSTRFAGRFDIDWQNCPPEYKNIAIPRLVIQPLIENAVKYGFENIENKGLLRLFFMKEGDVLKIVIESSGANMNEEKINAMNELLDISHENFEISSTINIHRRLILFFGNAYGLKFSLSDLGGVKIILSVACMT